RTILAGETLHFHDAASDPSYMVPAVRPADPAVREALAIRSWLGVPMLREGQPIGVIALSRSQVRPFSEREIALVKTFADQAVIAIENVRLFTELQEKNQALTQAHAQVTESLERQTATGEILSVISTSPTDVQPVFDAIVRNAVQLCGGVYGTVYRVEGELIYLVAHHNWPPGPLEQFRAIFPRPVGGVGLPVDRVIRTATVYRVADMQAEADVEISPEIRTLGWMSNWLAQDLRSLLIVPIFRHDHVIGAIAVLHRDVGAFTDVHVELLKTFAAQAVIAIENVRLFRELEAQTAALTRSVEQLTALGEVGRAVSSTLDLETVLSTIMSRAVQLSGLDGGVVFEYDEAAEEFVQRAMTDTSRTLAAARRTTR